MRPVSGALLAAIRGSHQMSVRATVVTSYYEGTSPSGTQIPVIDGSVSIDSTAQVWGTLDLTTDGSGWSTVPGASILQPYGNEIYVERGVGVGGSVEWTGLGYYRIQQAEQDQAPSGPLVISGSDRMQAIVDAMTVTPVSFAATATVADVFAVLVAGVYPSATVTFDWTASADTIGTALVVTTDTDRYQTLSDLATSRGKVMYFDYAGRLQVKSKPDPGVPVWHVDAGPNGVQVAAGRTLVRDGIYNAAVVTSDGASDAAPPLAVAYDNDPSSPTYYLGTFGQVPQFWSSPAVTTQAQAAAAAALVLSRSLALPLQCAFTAIPNPGLEVLDVISIDYLTGSDPPFTVDTITFPLTASAPLAGTGHSARTRIAVIGG
jgi:hypothetical protein